MGSPVVTYLGKTIYLETFKTYHFGIEFKGKILIFFLRAGGSPLNLFELLWEGVPLKSNQFYMGRGMLSHSILFKSLSGPYIEFYGKYSLRYFTNISNFKKWVGGNL